MFILGSKLKNIPVMSLATGSQAAMVTKPILDWRTLELPALWCQLQIPNDRTLGTSDIREMNPGIILINSEESLSEPGEVVRLSPILDEKWDLIGSPVKTESGSKLGKVIDYTINLTNFTVQKLYVKPSLVKSIVTESLIIDRTQIVDVTPSLIIVRDAYVTEPLASPAPVLPE